MQVLEKVREYICSKENKMLAREDLKEIYGSDFVEEILDKETNYLCSFFDEEKDYEVPFNDFVLLSRIFYNTKLNYREMGSVLSFVLNKNAKLIEHLDKDKLVSYTFTANGNPLNSEEEKQRVIKKFAIAPSIIRNYIDEDGHFIPVDVNEIDKQILKDLIFVLSDKQIETILFFCKKKYDELHKPEFIIKPVVINKEEDKINLKEAKILRKKLSSYIDDSGKLIKYLTEEDIIEVFRILENLKAENLENIKLEINKQNEKLLKIKKEDERLQEEGEFLEKFEEIKLECLKEHELLSYDYAKQILVNKDFIYPAIQEDIQIQIDDIDSILNEILKAKEEINEADEPLKQIANWSYTKTKSDLIELMSLSFFELYEILNNYALIEEPYKLERKKKEN